MGGRRGTLDLEAAWLPLEVSSGAKGGFGNTHAMVIIGVVQAEHVRSGDGHVWYWVSGKCTPEWDFAELPSEHAKTVRRPRNPKVGLVEWNSAFELFVGS